MRLHEILRTLSEEPLLITPAAHAALFKLFEEHAKLPIGEFKALREGENMSGEAVELDQMEVIDGIAHIPIAGPIGRGLGKFEKGAGAVDSQDIMDEIDEAEANDLVRAIILDIDSPGGMVSGTPECADRILAVNKPIYAFTAGMMCSAAYWLGCACDMVLASKSADIGSIGVYVPFLDTSERYKAAGVKVEVIASGKYKGAGVPGTSLTKDQRQHLQDRIDETAAMFADHVLACRPDVSADCMQGQAYKASTALALGLIDHIVGSKDDVIALL